MKKHPMLTKKRKWKSPFIASAKLHNLVNIEVIFEDKDLISEYGLQLEHISELVQTWDRLAWDSIKDGSFAPVAQPYFTKNGIKQLLITLLGKANKQYFYIERRS